MIRGNSCTRKRKIPRRLQVGGKLHVVLLEAFADASKGVVDRVGELEHFVFLLINHAPAHHGAEVENFIPILAAVNDDEVVARELAGLEQREHFPKLVHSAKAARENDESFGDLREPKFAHEEIVEIEAELRTDISVGELLVGQFDREADGFSAGFKGAAIGGFHYPRTAAGADDKAARFGTEGQRPTGDTVGELASFLVVARHFQSAFRVAQGFAMVGAVWSFQFRSGRFLEAREATLGGFMGFDAGGAEHHDGVADAFIFELHEGMQVLGQDAYWPGGGTFKELRILVWSFGCVLGLKLDVP